MDWQAIGTIIALLGVVASFGVAVRGQRQERELAERSASRSEAAARLTEEYTGRVVDALEAMVSQPRTSGKSNHPPRARWALVHQRGDTYRLTNVGNADAWDVLIDMHESMRDDPDNLAHERIRPDEAITFMAAPVMATPDYTVTVGWDFEQGKPSTREEWRYPLPVS
jgi:hypothetical protein